MIRVRVDSQGLRGGWARAEQLGRCMRPPLSTLHCFQLFQRHFNAPGPPYPVTLRVRNTALAVALAPKKQKKPKEPNTLEFRFSLFSASPRPSICRNGHTTRPHAKGTREDEIGCQRQVKQFL